MLEGPGIFLFNYAQTDFFIVPGDICAQPVPKATLRNRGVPDDQLPSPKSVSSKAKKF
jgi:hypothetical protein